MSPPNAIDETKDVLLFLEQQLRHAREAAMPLSRERVAALAYELSTILEHLANVAAALPDNDQDARVRAGEASPDDVVNRHGLLTFHEELSAGRDRRLVVASLGTRWYVLEGVRGAPMRTYDPGNRVFDQHEDATRAAIAMHKRSFKQARVRLQAVRG